jgi:ParB/RepB/Spo0J family partition protein
MSKKKSSPLEMIPAGPENVNAPTPDDMATPTFHEHEGVQEFIRVDLLDPNTWNAQVMDAEEFNRLVDEINEVGFTVPIQVVPLDNGRFRIIGGEHRWKAAKVVGMSTIPAYILTAKKWQDTDLQKFSSVRVNVIHGKLDPEKFIALYNEMVDKYGADNIQRLMGFVDESAFQKLVTGVKKGMRKSLPKELQGEFDAAAKQVKTVEDLSKVIQAMFTRYGDTVNQSFMVFSHGNKQHLYIAMNPQMKKAMDRVMEYCRKSGEDINDFMEPLTKAYMQTADSRIKRMTESEELEDAVGSDED